MRPAQVEAIDFILDERGDIVISSGTASGKTEAAFLPLLSRLQSGGGLGIVLYVAPMKSLIDDQADRLKIFCDRLGIAIYPWHGDIGQASRKKFFKNPNGLILTTPESLESLIFSRGRELKHILSGLEAVVIDELHAFIGTERGRQLQSLLHRIEELLDVRVQRIGLSATLGDITLAADFLRPDCGAEVRLLISTFDSKSLQLKLKVVIQPERTDGNRQHGHAAIVDELFKKFRKSNYLIFPVSTGLVEYYADGLRRLCDAAGLPVTFFPHHGRLAKSERGFAEVSLKSGALPVSVICTTTLEMGIDIGNIRGVVQIGAASTVAGLCQRVGRAGRRPSEVAELWQYCIENEIPSKSDCDEALRFGLVQSVAVIRLFLRNWYEPAVDGAPHYSTLVQQILSLIGERGGATASCSYEILCERGPFTGIDKVRFGELLQSMSDANLIAEDADGTLLHASLGERYVNHFTFFAAFPESREYRLIHAGKELGTLPLGPGCFPDDVLIFAGRPWRVIAVDHGKRRVELAVARKGNVPRTGGGAFPVHDQVRLEMRQVLRENFQAPWLSGMARNLLQSASKQFVDLELDSRTIVNEGKNVLVFTWRGDRIQRSIALLFEFHGMAAQSCGPFIKVAGTTIESVERVLFDISKSPCPAIDDLINRKVFGNIEKWDWVLPHCLYCENVALSQLDLPNARRQCELLTESILMEKAGVNSLKAVTSAFLSESSP